MNYIQLSPKIKAWVKNVQFEEQAKTQCLQIAEMPFVYPHIAVMPDVHWGMGAAIGSVIPTRGAIIPAAVGVDIGCGMKAAKTNLTASLLPDNLFNIRSAIEKAIPHGRTNNGRKGDRGAWNDVPKKTADIWTIFLENGYKNIKELNPKFNSYSTVEHLGTLGTGNHFIELCLDEEQNVWVMLHSGSRGVGNRIGTYFIEIAKEEMIRQGVYLENKDLAYLTEGSVFFDNYVKAVTWAQHFANANRNIMMLNILDVLSAEFGFPVSGFLSAIQCHHNYIASETHFDEDVWITRKGAISAEKDRLGIIPGSMGAKSFIVRGLGNPESFESCSHGAGRSMSRSHAKKVFTVEDHIKATENVECRKDEDVIDETPMAYKSIDAVMEAQKDLVEIVHTLKQIVCVKG